MRGKYKVCLEKYGSGQPQRFAQKEGEKCKNRSVPNSPFDYVIGLQIFEASIYWLELFIVDEKYTTIFFPTKAVCFSRVMEGLLLTAPYHPIHQLFLSTRDSLLWANLTFFVSRSQRMIVQA